MDREKPFYFSKSATALRPSGATIPYPPGTNNYHFEMELVVAIGAPAFKIAAADALNAVYGYACGLDMTRRDLQLSERAKQRPWTLGKDVEASAPVSTIARAAAIGHPARGAITLRQNGEIRQSADLSQMVWSVPEIIAHLSGFYHLGPGDLIFTGTPAGVGPVAPGDHAGGRHRRRRRTHGHDRREAVSADRPAVLDAIGVISGTSMDGIDVALIRSDGETRVEPGPGATFPYPQAVGRALREVIANPDAAHDPLDDLQRAVTDSHVEAVFAFMKKFDIVRENVALVGLHGQTILHRPRERFTRQLCDGARASRLLGLDVVNDFRAADVAAGGEGAPFVPLYHAAICAGLERPLMILNWGGVGNVTWLGANGEIVAFDTGPANALIDDFVARRRGLSHDEGGALAAAGRVDDRVLAGLMGDPYFDLRAAQIARPQSFSRAGARSGHARR